jgi:hypothetical protein
LGRLFLFGAQRIPDLQTFIEATLSNLVLRELGPVTGRSAKRLRN